MATLLPLTAEQVAAATALNKGTVYPYIINNCLYIETERGNDPFVWRWSTKQWRRMRRGRS